MNGKIILGMYKLNKEILQELVKSFYGSNNSIIIEIKNIEDINKMKLLETPDILFVASKEVSIEIIKKLNPTSKNMVVFSLDIDLSKSNIHFVCNLDYINNNEILSQSERIETIARKIRKNKEDLLMSYNDISIESIKFYLDLIDMWDHYTKGHCERSTKYTTIFTNFVGLSTSQKNLICKACMIHDFGKIAIPRNILENTGKLTESEYETIKQHASIIDNFLPFPQFEEIRTIIKAHHERFDGTGYPCGLSGDSIPLGARIIAVMDSFDAMTTNRGYNRVKTKEEAISEIIRCSGTQFDPEIVDSFVYLLKNDNSLINYFYEHQRLNQSENFGYQKTKQEV